MNWETHHLSWKEKVGEVEVPIQIDKSDMLKAIMSEGDFAFKGKDGTFTLMNLKKYHAKKNKDITLLKKVLWNQVEEYVKKECGLDAKDKLNATEKR